MRLYIFVCLWAIVITGCGEEQFVGEDFQQHQSASLTQNSENSDILEPIRHDIPDENPDTQPAPQPNNDYLKTYLHDFDWHRKHPDSDLWSKWAQEAIIELGENLTKVTPLDVKKFCPSYHKFNSQRKIVFWISLLAAMTRYESYFRPAVSYTESFKDRNGNYIVSRGLLQMSIESSRGYDCQLRNAQQLHDPKSNLRCAVRILNRWIGRDKVISAKISSSWKGGARYWSVLRTPTRVSQIKSKTASTPVCHQ